MRGLIVSAFMLLGCIQAFGQESRKEVCIGFPVGDSTLDTAYGDNATRLSEVVSFLESVKKDNTLELVGVSFCGSASPEGGFAINKELAEKRRNSLERYVRERISLPDGIISRPEGFIAWNALQSWSRCPICPTRKRRWTCCATYPNLPIIIKVYWLTAARNT